jgi:hypothetical protein
MLGETAQEAHSLCELEHDLPGRCEWIFGVSPVAVALLQRAADGYPLARRHATAAGPRVPHALPRPLADVSSAVVLLSVQVPPAVRPKAAGRARASYQVVYILPDRRQTGRSFLNIDLRVSFGKHLLRGGGISSLPDFLYYDRRWLSYLYTVERHVHPQLLTCTKQLVPLGELSIHQELVDIYSIEVPRHVTF